jgi:F-type H+-transporting ATPase subunit epsilon
MSDTLSLKIITPERIVVDDDNIDSIEATGIEGEFHVYSGHTSFLTALAMGHIFYHNAEGDFHHISISEGFFEVKSNNVVILVRCAEKAEEIDIKRAEESVKRAQRRLMADDKKGIDTARAELSLKRAENRLWIARIKEGL